MYKLVASDMDETFLDGEHRIPEANLAALRRMKELGIPFVPSSGRPYRSIMHNFRDIDPALLEDSYVISFNGGFINRFGDETPLVTTSMERDVIEHLYQLGRELGLCQHIYPANGDIYTCDPTPSEHAYLSTLSDIIFFDSAAHDDLSFIGEGPFVKILYMSDDFSQLLALEKELGPELTERGIDITFSSNRYIEFMPAGVNKGTGLAKLAELLGIDIAETIGMGDSANDLAMLLDAGLGVGVANVADNVRHACDVVLETNAEDGALAEVVERFLEPEACR